MNAWEEVDEGRWRLAPERGGFCCEVEASYAWFVEGAPGRELHVGPHAGHATLAACMADAESLDASALEGAVREGLVEALRSRSGRRTVVVDAAGRGARPALAFGQEDEGLWAAPLVAGEDYPRVCVRSRFHPLYGPWPEGWRKAAAEPRRTLAEAMRACEERMEDAGW